VISDIVENLTQARTQGLGFVDVVFDKVFYDEIS